MKDVERFFWCISGLILTIVNLAWIIVWFFDTSPTLGAFCGAEFVPAHYTLSTVDAHLLFTWLTLDGIYVAAFFLRVLLGMDRLRIYYAERERREGHGYDVPRYYEAAKMLAENERLRKLLKACAL